MPKPAMVDSDKYRVSGHLPDSLLTWGTVTEVGDQELTVGANETLVVDVALSAAIPAGHTLEIWTHFVSDIQRPQLADASMPAYFSCEGGDVAFEPFVRPDAKVHGPGSFFPYRRFAGPVLEAAMSPLGTSELAAAGADLRSRLLADVAAILDGTGDADPIGMHLFWTMFLGVLAFWTGDASPHQEDTLVVLDRAMTLFAEGVSR